MDARELKIEADRHFDSGELQEALAAYQRFSQLRPGNLHAWNRQASIHGMLGQFREAAGCCEKALAINPGIAMIHANYGKTLIELERYEEAVPVFRKALELDPRDRNSLAMLGNLYRMLGKPAAAQECLRRLAALEPASVETAHQLAAVLLDSGNTAESVDLAEQALSRAPGNRALLATLLEGSFLSGDLDRADRHISQAHSRLPNIPRLAYRVCRKFYDSGNYAEAEVALQTALRTFPDDDYFRVLLADCQVRHGSIEAASRTLEHLSGGDITLEASVMLANTYGDIGRAEESRQRLAEIVRLHPDETLPRLALSHRLVNAGRYEEARALLDDFSRKHPDSHRVLVELGSLCELEGDFEAAERHYRRAIEVEPGYAFAHCRLGALSQGNKRFAEAKQCFERAIECDPNLLTAQCSLAFLHCHAGEYEQAQSIYDRVLAVEPELEAAISGKATVLERLGDMQASARLLDPIVTAGTENIHTLMAYARSCTAIGQESRAIRLLEAALDRPGVLPDERMHASFTLGKLLDRIGEYDHAFANYRRGNELSRFPFDRESHRRFVDALCSVFSPDNRPTLPGSSNPDARPVFIVGMPRSGTTLTEQILASHPAVHGAGELPHIRNMAAAIPVRAGLQQTFPLCMPEISPALMDEFSSMHSRALTALAGNKRIITDKMPSNFMFLGLIELLFPNARVLHCVRDPLDTCLSCYFQNFSREQYFSYKLSDLGSYYTQYRRLMAHWQAVLRIPVMEIQYEHLVEDLEQTSRKMLDFMGLDWHDACLDFHKSERSIRTASYDQVRRPIYRSSVGRWKHYEGHLAELIDALAAPD